MVVYNDVDPDEKIRLYQIEETFDPERESAIVPTFRLGDVRIPRLPQEEPLHAMAERFDAAARRPGARDRLGVRGPGPARPRGGPTSLPAESGADPAPAGP